MNGRSLSDHRPSHPENVGTEHVRRGGRSLRLETSREKTATNNLHERIHQPFSQAQSIQVVIIEWCAQDRGQRRKGESRIASVATGKQTLEEGGGGQDSRSYAGRAFSAQAALLLERIQSRTLRKVLRISSKQGELAARVYNMTRHGMELYRNTHQIELLNSSSSHTNAENAAVATITTQIRTPPHPTPPPSARLHTSKHPHGK